MPGGAGRLDEPSWWAGAQATCRKGTPQVTAASPPASQMPPSACPAVPSPSPILSHHSDTAGDSLFPLELEVP